MSLFEFTASDIQALANLLAPQTTSETSKVEPDDAVSSSSRSELTKPSPASIGPKDLLPVTVAPPRAHGRGGDVKPSQPDLLDDEDTDDGRVTPEYEFRYKQSVTTSDNFLGMSGKDSSSTCCEQLVVVAQLPLATTAAELELDTTPTQLRLTSSKYKLRLCLPHKEDSERGSAKWDSKKKALCITLPIIREDPFA